MRSLALLIAALVGLAAMPASAREYKGPHPLGRAILPRRGR
jgi:hypothetical protein